MCEPAHRLRRVHPVGRLRSRLHAAQSDRGASAVELAVVAPGLLFLIFLSIQAGLFYYGRVVAEQAAREGVSQLRLAQDAAVARTISADVEQGVRDYASTVGRETLLSPTAVADYDEQAGQVSMTVSGQVVSLVPGLDLTVTQQVFGRIERFEGDERPR